MMTGGCTPAFKSKWLMTMHIVLTMEWWAINRYKPSNSKMEAELLDVEIFLFGNLAA